MINLIVDIIARSCLTCIIVAWGLCVPHALAFASAPSFYELPQVAVKRGELFFGVPEQFNRYYTDIKWQPKRVIYVSPNGAGLSQSVNSRENPWHINVLYRHLKPGDKVVFLAGTYKDVNIRLSDVHSGTYNDPIVFYGERDARGELAAILQCRSQGRRSNHYRSCFNLENTHYIAIDGFVFAGIDNKFEASYFGVRAVGASMAASQHQKGFAILNSKLSYFYKDPIFTGQSDWVVVQNNLATHGGKGDGHGIYLSNGSDFNVVRFNELHSNVSSDFQVNADPHFACKGIELTSPECDGDAKEGLGRGASDYFLIEGNYFHHGLAQGPNLTSMRHSIYRHNIMAFYARHNTSFWQETTNMKLGSHSNEIAYNLFIGKRRETHVLQLIRGAHHNTVHNNVIVGMNLRGQFIDKANLIDTDATIFENTYKDNVFIGGRLSEALQSTGYYYPEFEIATTPIHLNFKATDFLPRKGSVVWEKAKWAPAVMAPK